MNDKKEYWDGRWLKGNTGWDIGYASPPLIEFCRPLKDKSISLLIPGCGSAYEALQFVDMGFTDITLLDISPTMVELLHKKYGHLEQIHIVCGDLTDLKSSSFDLILEQTFFCTVPPADREDLLMEIVNLLKHGGIYAGVVFDALFQSGPPFGGPADGYRPLFEKFFYVEIFEMCYNSIGPRQDAEYFMKLIKK